MTALAAGLAILMAGFVAGDSLNVAALAGGWDVLHGAASLPRAAISRCTWLGSTSRMGRKFESALAGRKRSVRSSAIRSFKPEGPAAR